DLRRRSSACWLHGGRPAPRAWRTCSPRTPWRVAWRGRRRAPDAGRAGGRPRASDLRARDGPFPRGEGGGRPGAALLDRLRAAAVAAPPRGDGILALSESPGTLRQDRDA